ncbi:hypothetical protein ACQV5M_03740 [Leptospira sp. SA-E8]|uniref:hypothetical protein n=1 Tax=Leptospira sp. SA-E8 TaxID=3422259 RepID=UPI003EBDF21F
MNFTTVETRHIIKVETIEARRLAIKEKLNGASTVPFHFHYAGNGTTNLPEVTLSIDLPVYRVANGRTKTYQMEYTRQRLKGKKDESFFAQGEEDVETQKAQHEILYALSSEGKGESIISIKEKLEQDAHQTEPILISREGVVINGNRRLAAMRELFSEDSAKYSGFSHINALVLGPGVTEEELLTIEFKMQMAPESKLPYSWVNQALSFRRMYEIKNSYDPLIRAMGNTLTEKQIKAKLAALEEAEIYLSKYLKQPGAYNRVEQHEEHFRNLQERANVPSAIEQTAIRAIGHVLAKHSSELNVRVHDLRETFGKDLKNVARDLVELHKWESPKEDTTGGIFNSEKTPEEVMLMTVVQELENATEVESKKIALEIKDLQDTLRATRKDEALGSAALLNAQKAHKLLQEINPAEAQSDSIDGLIAQLNQIITRAKDLIKIADKKIFPKS